MNVPAKQPRRAAGLYTDVFLPEETLELRNRARSFAEVELKPLASDLNTLPESVDRFPWQLLAKMGDAGLLGIPYPKDIGGLGLEYPVLASQVLEEELAYFSNGAAATLYDAPMALLGASLLRYGSDLLKQKYLPRLISGSCTGSFATSEPAASTDLSVSSIQTTAKRTEGGYIVNGTKRWITNAPVAEFMVFLCRLDDGLTMLLVDMDSDGVTVGKPDKKLGNLAQLTADVAFVDVFVPVSNLVGVEGRGLRVALSALSEGRIAVGSMAVGMAQAAFDIATSFMESRYVFGKPLSSMQHWQNVFASYAIELENARALCHKAAYLLDTTGSTESPCGPMAKVYATNLSRRIASDAIQVCGAMGFVRELGATGELRPLETIYRDSKIGEIYEGTNEVMLSVISRAIFGRSAM